MDHSTVLKLGPASAKYGGPFCVILLASAKLTTMAIMSGVIHVSKVHDQI